LTAGVQINELKVEMEPEITTIRNKISAGYEKGNYGAVHQYIKTLLNCV
jgi:hypothetical protein